MGLRDSGILAFFNLLHSFKNRFFCMNANSSPKIHFYVMEKFCDYFTLRPNDLNIILTYVLLDNFFFLNIYSFFMLGLWAINSKHI